MSAKSQNKAGMLLLMARRPSTKHERSQWGQQRTAARKGGR